MTEGFVDPYVDPETGVLRNLIGAKTYDELQNAEGEFVAIRMSELFQSELPHVTGSLDDFCFLHRALFRDIYAWAGETRRVEIRKNVEQSEFFLPSANISMGFSWSQAELARDDFLKGLESVDRLCERLAYHFDNYNFIHPFREGNGRTQRLFWTLLCHEAGYDLDWRMVSGEENDEASRLAAEDRDYAALIGIFRRIAVPCNAELPLIIGLLGSGHLPAK